MSASSTLLPKERKVVLLGSFGCGKTCLVIRLSTDEFDVNTTSTIAAAYKAHTVLVPSGESVRLSIWDTGGTERFDAIAHLYYRKAAAGILCFDLADKASFSKADHWYRKLQCEEESCRIYLCGMKLDLIEDNLNDRAVSEEHAKEYALRIGATYFETVAKDVTATLDKRDAPVHVTKSERRQCKC